MSVRPRVKDFEYIGRNAYHVVTVTRVRQPLLVDDVATETVRLVRDTSEHMQFELLSFVVMPDHVHLLVQGRNDDSSLVRFVQRFKQLTGYAFQQRTGDELWQRSFYDRIVRKNDDVAAMARYIVQNPERVGLVQPGIRWPHAGGVLVDPEPALLPSGAEAPPLLEVT